jgi:hypothetical protein
MSTCLSEPKISIAQFYSDMGATQRGELFLCETKGSYDAYTENVGCQIHSTIKIKLYVCKSGCSLNLPVSASRFRVLAQGAPARS